VDVSLVLLAGLAVGALLGVFKGLLARRLRGDFLAVATLTLGLLARQVIINLRDVTGGAGGLGGFGPLHFLGLNLYSPTIKFYLVWVFVFLAAWASQRLIHSRTGRAWLASSEDELASISVGVNVTGARMGAFVLSSALAGLAGALYAGTLSYVDPETMSFHISSMVLAMVILGGAGDVSGAILGAVAIVLYDKVFVPQLATWVSLIWPAGLAIGSAPDIRGASFFNFGIALYLTVLWRAKRRTPN
jgi:branched-chain amino acid transport system permease protein